MPTASSHRHEHRSEDFHESRTEYPPGDRRHDRMSFPYRFLAGALITGSVALGAAAPVEAQETLSVVFRPAGAMVEDAEAGKGLDVEIIDRFLAWHRAKKGDAIRVSRSTVTSVPELLEAVRAGEADLGLGGITITAERDRVVDFSEPYLPVRMVLIAPEGSVSGGVEGLAGKTIGAITGSTNAAEAARVAARVEGVSVDTSFPTNAELFDALRGEGLQGAVVDVTHFWSLGKPEGLEIVESLGDPQGLGAVFPQGSPWKATFDEFLEDFSGTSGYFRLVRKYFGADAEQMVRVARGG